MQKLASLTTPRKSKLIAYFCFDKIVFAAFVARTRIFWILCYYSYGFSANVNGPKWVSPCGNCFIFRTIICNDFKKRTEVFFRLIFVPWSIESMQVIVVKAIISLGLLFINSVFITFTLARWRCVIFVAISWANRFCQLSGQSN